MNKKKIYLQPISTVTRVELESPICSGSADVVNNEAKIGINAQKVNTEFQIGDLTSDGWETVNESTSNQQ